MTDLIKTLPAVFAVGENYQIMVEVTAPTLMWVEVGGECFFDDSNGIIRSAVTTHRATVPAELLNKEGRYTLWLRKIIERKPYFPTTEPPVSLTLDFRPVKSGTVRFYQIADAHNMVDAPIKACRAFEREYGEIDFLLLNGDVIDHSGRIENFHNIYLLAAELTGGTKPTVVSRGNHDTRGIFAENIADHTPTENGNSYFYVKLGDIGAVLLDCGEDKNDDHAEYGFTVCCHEFRRRETRWLEKLLDSDVFADSKHRLVISHVPFTWKIGDESSPFNIESEIYSRWAELLSEKFRPELQITGHMHELDIRDPGSERERFLSPCKVVTGSKPDHKNSYFVGSGFVSSDVGIEIYFTDSEGKVL